MPLLNHFNLLAPYYDAIIRSGDFSELINLIQLPSSGLILDAGGGTGRVSQSLVGVERSVILVDLSYKMLRQAQQKDYCFPVCSYVERLPFEDGKFDRIIMVDALHHVVRQTTTAEELWRVLKPDAMIVIEEPNIRKFIVKIVAFLEKISFMRSKFLKGDSIAKLFKFQGAEISIRYSRSNVDVVIRRTLDSEI
jgi:ubiquinone/menaquinone biosynthesis C-methylase UbiE